MASKRWLGAAAPLLVALLLAGCGTPRNYVVLLEQPDGGSSAVTLTNAGGRTTIGRPGEAVGVDGAASAPGEPFRPSAEELRQTFGAALAAQPQPPFTFVLYFNLDTAELTAESRRRLREILEQVRRRPAPEAVVVGHTDNLGPPEYNYELGLKRAALVRDQLVAIGVDPAVIEVTSHGANNPLLRNRPNAGQPSNRRVEVTVR
jgi:outer membrane protein OmpA-like peptidoglycan-associated protein